MLYAEEYVNPDTKLADCLYQCEKTSRSNANKELKLLFKVFLYSNFTSDELGFRFSSFSCCFNVVFFINAVDEAVSFEHTLSIYSFGR